MVLVSYVNLIEYYMWLAPLKDKFPSKRLPWILDHNLHKRAHNSWHGFGSYYTWLNLYDFVRLAFIIKSKCSKSFFREMYGILLGSSAYLVFIFLNMQCKSSEQLFTFFFTFEEINKSFLTIFTS